MFAGVQVLKDKLQYFAKRDDYRANKEPEAYIRMSQVSSIVFYPDPLAFGSSWSILWFT